MNKKAWYYLLGIVLVSIWVSISGCMKSRTTPWYYCTHTSGCMVSSHSYGIFTYDQSNTIITTDSGICSGVSDCQYLGYHVNAVKYGGPKLQGPWMATSDGVKKHVLGMWYRDTIVGVLTSSLTYDLLFVDTTLWVTTSAGVSSYNTTTGQSTNYSMPDVHNITIDINHDIWVTSDHGLKKYDGATWTSYGTSDGLPANSYKRILASVDGNLYIQISDAEGGGFIKYRNGSWTRYGTSNGLLSDSLGGWAQNNDWRLWICTPRGISIFDGSHFDNLVLGHQSNGQGLPAGYPPLDISTNGMSDYVVTTDGYILIPNY